MARTPLTITLHSDKGTDEMLPYDPTRKRRAISKDEKICALLIQAKLVDREWAKSKNCKQILQQVEWDHDPVPVAWGGTNHPTNLTARTVADHLEKTTKKDIKAIAKVRRALKKQIKDERLAADRRLGMAPLKPEGGHYHPDPKDEAACLECSGIKHMKAKPKWPTQKRAWPKRKMRGR